MAKSKLTRNQTHRIQAKKNQILTDHYNSDKKNSSISKKSNSKNNIDWENDLLGELQEGTVVARYSMHADIEDPKRERFRCNLRRTLTNLVVGDKVVWRKGHIQLQGISGVIEAVHPRKSELVRPDPYDGVKLIASNIDHIIVVCSILPKLSLNIIDRYLVVCENAKIPAVIVINKIDLLSLLKYKEVEQQLAIYRQIGYPLLFISAKNGHDLDKLTALLKDKTAILVGQSGVGKSSIINHILPAVKLATTEVSSTSGLGQHTTTASNLYHLLEGGSLIDSPGIREFGLWHLTTNQITAGYKEFTPFLGQCKFRDCKHLTDPHCALRDAVETGKINADRFKNYHRLIKALDENEIRK